MSATPISDKAAILCCHVVACPMEVARYLERELDASRVFAAEEAKFNLIRQARIETLEAALDSALSSRNPLPKPATPHAPSDSADKVRLAEVQKLYDELLYGVVRKWNHETRHQTALRYINQAEAPILAGNGGNTAMQSAPKPPCSGTEEKL